MKNVTLIGDSIRLSYQEGVMDRLADWATVTGPEENCRFSAYTLFNIESWVLPDAADIVHWNNGQWDTCYMADEKIHTPLPVYLDLQERIADILQERTPRLIFATTTPVWPDMFDQDRIHRRRNEDIEAYNAAVVERMTARGIEINDLHAVVASDIKRYICDDRVHLTDDGKALCADRVAEIIKGDPS